jgi:hypothetical protein
MTDVADEEMRAAANSCGGPACCYLCPGLEGKTDSGFCDRFGRFRRGVFDVSSACGLCVRRARKRRFPESRRKAYYLMSIHEHLPPQVRKELKQMGWTKGRELAKLVRAQGQ